MPSIKLELGVEQVQVILNALGNLPFAQVEALVQDIRNQAVPQLEPKQDQELINNEAP